jgi:predicted nucleic acid-binding protein
MKLYLDSAYIAKCYLNDPDAPKVRKLVQRAESLHSSAWCLAEMACVFQRRVREKSLNPEEGAQLRRIFLDHVSQGVWVLLPLDDSILRAVDASLDTLPPQVMLRAGDAVHLVSARAEGFSEIWSNDRHLLRAAPHFRLTGRSV